jgi:hypothetical protein
VDVAASTEETAGVLAYRDRALQPDFTLRAHLGKVAAVAAAILAAGVWLARASPAWHWLALPTFWAIANFFEWGIHRFPMHRPLQPRILYTNHAIVHHRSFAGAAQEIRDRRDLSLVMMPWYTLVFVFVMASPVALVAWLLGGPGLAGVFLVGSVTYFLFYELIHTLHHLPRARIERLPLASALVFLRAHHHHHHQLQHMARCNFNVTVPLADWVLRTSERG